MTQIVENWARVVGRIEAWEPPAEPEGAGTLMVRVESISDIARERGTAYRNLLKGDEGRTLRVLIPAAAAPRLNPVVGKPIQVDVRRGRSPDHVFARAEPFSER